ALEHRELQPAAVAVHQLEHASPALVVADVVGDDIEPFLDHDSDNAGRTTEDGFRSHGGPSGASTRVLRLSCPSSVVRPPFTAPDNAGTLRSRPRGAARAAAPALPAGAAS